MEKFEIDDNLAYDIGAFTGDTVGMIVNMGYHSVVCFEPNPAAYQGIVSSFKGSDTIRAENLAVSDTSGKKVKMTIVPEHPYLNSLEPSWFTTERHNMVMQNAYEIEVETVTLDDYIEKSGKIPAYIKVDAEGHEIAIFKGLHYKPKMISFEWISEFYEKNVECLRMLHELGFQHFRVGYREEVLSKDEGGFSFEECCRVLKDHNEKDTSRTIWGNIWCS